jgi:hypothetical protein
MYLTKIICEWALFPFCVRDSHSHDYEEYYLQGYDTVQSGRSSPSFLFADFVFAGCLFGLVLYPEDGGSMLFRNMDELVPDYKALT